MGTKREHAVENVIQDPWSAPAPTGADESEQQRLAQEIAAQIVAGHGSVVRWTAELPDVEDWHRAARRRRRFEDVGDVFGGFGVLHWGVGRRLRG